MLSSETAEQMQLCRWIEVSTLERRNFPLFLINFVHYDYPVRSFSLSLF